MKKTISIGVFIFGLTLNCCAYAQTHIQISGCVDTSIVKEGGADTRFDEKNPNKIAFRGSQTLNPLYTFTFELEKEFLLPDGSYKEDNGFDGKIASRLQKRSNVEFLGAANLGFQTPVGHFRFGRVPEISVKNYTLIDPFEQGASGAALAKYTLLRSEQVSKAMRFDSKNNQGFNYSFAYLLGSDKHNQQNKKNDMHDGFTLGTTYQNGPVFLTSNFYRPSDSDKSFVFNIGSTYTFHDVRFSGGFQTSKLKNIHSILDGDYEDIIDCDVAQKTFLLGLQVPYQNYTFNASYNKAYVKNITVHEKRYDGHLDKIALGSVYALSKRTSIYAITTYVKSDNGTIYSFHNDTGSTSTHSHGYQLGITHLF